MGLTRENKKLFICPEESMNTAGICRFGLPAAISSSGGGTCILLLAKPSPPATLRPQVRVAGPLLSFEGEHLAQTWPFYQHWFRDGHSRGRPPKVTVLFLSVHSLPDQCLYPLHMADLPQDLPQASTLLLVSLVTKEPTRCQFLPL